MKLRSLFDITSDQGSERFAYFLGACFVVFVIASIVWTALKEPLS